MAIADDLAPARDVLARATRILAASHINPDGDAVGSLLGFGLALQAAGKDVVMAIADPVPDTFNFLPGARSIVTAPAGEFDAFVSLDASDLARLGRVAELAARPPDLLFDHHITNPGFAAINLIDPEAASTAELIAEHAAALGLPVTPDVAQCLLTGVVNDTLGFRTSSVTAKTLALAQGLMRAGGDLHTVYESSLNKRSFTALRLWAEGLTLLNFKDGIVWTRLPLAARKASGYRGNGDADLINLLATVREARVAMIFVEHADGKVKISWRAVPGLNVAEVAASFGGGGHAPAAGAEVAGTLDEVEARVLQATRAMLAAPAAAAA